MALVGLNLWLYVKCCNKCHDAVRCIITPQRDDHAVTLTNNNPTQLYLNQDLLSKLEQSYSRQFALLRTPFLQACERAYQGACSMSSFAVQPVQFTLFCMRRKMQVALMHCPQAKEASMLALVLGDPLPHGNRPAMGPTWTMLAGCSARASRSCRLQQVVTPNPSGNILYHTLPTSMQLCFHLHADSELT